MTILCPSTWLQYCRAKANSSNCLLVTVNNYYFVTMYVTKLYHTTQNSFPSEHETFVPCCFIADPILSLKPLMSTTVDILRFYRHLYSELLKVKCAFNFETLIYVRFTNNTNFQSLEVVDRGSETQLQVTENSN